MTIDLDLEISQAGWLVADHSTWATSWHPGNLLPLPLPSFEHLSTKEI